MELLDYDPLVYITAAIYLLGAVNQYILLKAIYIILEQPYSLSGLRLKAALWPWEVVTTVWVSWTEPDEEDEL
jgi:hypothetical protein|tara:strand:+ start:336 stop:554 length:219 start_codon:yes stop_codon:yes gene_type:complete